MNTLFLGIITLASVIVAIVLIYVLFEVRETVKRLKEFITNTEISLKPALEELPQALRNVRHITDDMTRVTRDVKNLSGSIRVVGQNIERAAGIVGTVTTISALRFSGLKAGIRAGLGVLLRSMTSKKKQLERR